MAPRRRRRRLSRSGEFERVYREGRSHANRYLVVYAFPRSENEGEPRLGISVSNPPDMIESKLAALEAYQLSLVSPAPPSGSFDAAAATRGRAVFDGSGQCASCHTGSALTDVLESITLADIIDGTVPGPPPVASGDLTGAGR